MISGSGGTWRRRRSASPILWGVIVSSTSWARVCREALSQATEFDGRLLDCGAEGRESPVLYLTPLHRISLGDPAHLEVELASDLFEVGQPLDRHLGGCTDRKSTRLNSSHVANSYAVFCLK